MAAGAGAALTAKGVPNGSSASNASGAASRAANDVARPAPSPVPVAGEKVVKTADLRVRVGRRGFAGAFDAAASIAARDQGFVADSSSTPSGQDRASGSLTIRVPAAAFDDALRDLRGLGKV